jgi:2-polyprenyl-3-methyl-5-hydroxy-6-metoxy-1,4-benzoquinol methylase
MGVMKPEPVTTFRDEDEAAGDANREALSDSLVERLRHPKDAAVRPRAPVARSAQSGATPVDLDDVNNARSLAVLSVRPYSKVLDVGSGSGVVARALAARGCRVWGIDVDSAAVRLTKPWCDGILIGDAETADLVALLGPQRVDAILFLDVLEHLRDPAAAIRRVLPFLAPGGTIILSVPNVAHAAVRLQLLAGAFPRTSEGLLDRTHLHFFDRASLHALLIYAGMRVIDEARVVRSVEDTEIPVNLATFPQEAIDVATAGPDADTYQFVVTVAPSALGTAVERMPTLASTLTEHLHRLERSCRLLQERARDIDSQVDEYRCEHDRLHEALEEERDRHRQAATSVAAVSEELRRSELERQQSEKQLVRTTDELVRCQLERRFLRDDVVLKDAYLATLRQQATQHRQTHAENGVLTERLDDLATEHAAAVNRAADLAESNREVRQQLERSQQELHRLHAAVADTLAQPRYVVADRFNAWARKVGFLHAALKRMWAASYRAR